jgi:two-component system response regulator
MLLNDIEILLIEDNYDDAELVIRTFKKNNVGNNLVHLTNGVEALDFLFARGKFSERKIENRPKVILLDLKMPQLDGLQVLKIIKEDERTKAIPVVIMTTSSDAKDIIESYQLGVNSYVVKPVNFTDFAKAVSDLGFYWVLLNRLPK